MPRLHSTLGSLINDLIYLDFLVRTFIPVSIALHWFTATGIWHSDGKIIIDKEFVPLVQIVQQSNPEPIDPLSPAKVSVPPIIIRSSKNATPPYLDVQLLIKTPTP